MRLSSVPIQMPIPAQIRVPHISILRWVHRAFSTTAFCQRHYKSNGTSKTAKPASPAVP
jgi:hypothetical protein